MSTFFALCGIVLSFLIIKYREMVGNSIGQADWMYKVGGVYNVIVFVAILIFLWSLATLTGTTDIFLSPILKIVGIDTTKEVAPVVGPERF